MERLGIEDDGEEAVTLGAKRSRGIGAVLLVLAAAGGAAEAQEIWSPEWREWRVRLRVAASPEIREQVESYFRRELRSLGDVVLVEQYPDLEVSVVAILTRGPGEEPTGISFSTVFLERHDNRPLLEWLGFLARDEQETELLRTLARETGGLGRILAHRMKVGPPDSARRLSEEMVIEFDRDHLEPRRRARMEGSEIEPPPPALPLPDDLYMPGEPLGVEELELEAPELLEPAPEPVDPGAEAEPEPDPEPDDRAG